MIKLKCPKCGSSQIQSRISDQTRWCRRCGYQAPAKEFVKEEERWQSEKRQ
jgi:DNA-directed RNA polymerase subunit M/transcription elongation factor TFIIS